ncbi:MAG: histidine phosphatase family protein [Aestuariivita sp.]|nr:histidine phosphatase family protein [Aestuariivita sp.]
MITHWYWVRHGPTHARAVNGWTDIPADLSDGHQIDRLNKHLPADAKIIASDLTRASATADKLSKHRVRLPDHAGLREFNFGEWEGQDTSNIATSYPELSRRYWEHPGDARPPRGESWNSAARRIHSTVDAIQVEQTSTPIIAVAHYGVILTQLQRARDVAATTIIQQNIDHFSVTKLRCDGATWHLCYVNFLP